jgi:hypothetical protein
MRCPSNREDTSEGVDAVKGGFPDPQVPGELNWIAAPGVRHTTSIGPADALRGQLQVEHFLDPCPAGGANYRRTL